MAVPRLQFSRLYFRAADTRIQECGGEAEGPISSAGRNSHSSNASGRQSTMGVVRRFMMPFSKTTVSSDLSLTGVVPDDGADADSRSSTALRRQTLCLIGGRSRWPSLNRNGRKVRRRGNKKGHR